MNATEITYGIEIETTIPRGALDVGSYHGGAAIPGLPGWTAKSDSSIRAGRGRQGCEFVSPVLKGADGIRQVKAAVAFIKSIDGRVNASCGVHVHVGFNKTDTDASQRLATLVANFEKAIFATTGTRNRENGGFCRPLQRYGNVNDALRVAGGNRYHVCNFATNKPTVEFRAFSASLDDKKIVSWIMLSVGVVERALKAARPTNWTAKPVSPTSPIARKGGEGQTALTRLFYQLGWIKGRQSHTFGNVADVAPAELKGLKRKLMELARKYDAQQ
jgi:hypothetical protein